MFHKVEVLGGGEAVWMEIFPYIWNAEETRVIQLRGISMACLNCKGLNWWNELVELIWTFHGNSYRLTVLHLWERVCRVENKSPLRRPYTWFWALSKPESEDWEAAAMIWQPYSIFGLIWSCVARLPVGSRLKVKLLAPYPTLLL